MNEYFEQSLKEFHREFRERTDRGDTIMASASLHYLIGMRRGAAALLGVDSPEYGTADDYITKCFNYQLFNLCKPATPSKAA